MGIQGNIRLWGASHRETLMGLYNAVGDQNGLAVAYRFVWEASKVVAEINGPQHAVELLYKISDMVPVGGVPAMPVEIATVVPPPPVKVPWKITLWDAGVFIAGMLAAWAMRP